LFDHSDNRMVLGVLSSDHLLNFLNEFRTGDYHNFFSQLAKLDEVVRESKLPVRLYHMKKSVERDLIRLLRFSFDPV
jgi:hypothetical protein